VGVELAGVNQRLNIEDSLEELTLLAETAGLKVVGKVTQKLDKPNPKTFIGKGKVKELQDLAEEKLVDIVLFDDELSPRHQRELERVFGEHVRVIDRTALILDIFAQHARTREGAFQVELAQYEYRLPRLTRAWTHLARQTGGGVNYLSDSKVYVADKLFATLDPTTRRVKLPNKKVVLFTDTVGFIQKLPTTLVAAFRATLDEIVDADLLLHIVDITHPNVREQAKSVFETLKEIGADHIPVVTVLNKIDLLEEPSVARQRLIQFDKAVAISAKTGVGINDLLETIGDELYSTYVQIDMLLPYQEGKTISLIRNYGHVIQEEYVDGGIRLKAKIPGRFAAQIKRYAK